MHLALVVIHPQSTLPQIRQGHLLQDHLTMDRQGHLLQDHQTMDRQGHLLQDHLPIDRQGHLAHGVAGGFRRKQTDSEIEVG